MRAQVKIQKIIYVYEEIHFERARLPLSGLTKSKNLRIIMILPLVVGTKHQSTIEKKKINPSFSQYASKRKKETQTEIFLQHASLQIPFLITFAIPGNNIFD